MEAVLATSSRLTLKWIRVKVVWKFRENVVFVYCLVALSLADCWNWKETRVEKTENLLLSWKSRKRVNAKTYVLLWNWILFMLFVAVMATLISRAAAAATLLTWTNQRHMALFLLACLLVLLQPVGSSVTSGISSTLAIIRLYCCVAIEKAQSISGCVYCQGPHLSLNSCVPFSSPT